MYVNKPSIMGILNVTPDSFSDGGKYNTYESALIHAEQMFIEGADIVDIGGESTRPGSKPVSVDEELSRTIPIVERVSQMGRVSIDTKKAEVAVEAVKAGATIINDVSASLGYVAAENNVGWIAMHMQGTPETMQDKPTYDDPVSQVLEYLIQKAEAARKLGVVEIWIDPGFGFGKSLDHNLDLLANINRFVATDFFVATGTSRKSMLSLLLAKSDGVEQTISEDDRLEGSLATATYAMLNGVQLLRVHEVKETVIARSVIAGS